MLWLGPALVFYVAFASFIVARRRLATVVRLRARDAGGLTRAIRSRAREDLARARAGARPDSFEALVLEAVLSEEAKSVRVAIVNEHLGDLDRVIDAQRDVSNVIGRAALMSGTLASVVELAMTLPSAGGPAWAPAATSFVFGIAGWATTGEMERRARSLSNRVRAEWDGIAAALGDYLSPEENVGP